jgi:hypothetical protein
VRTAAPAVAPLPLWPPLAARMHCMHACMQCAHVRGCLRVRATARLRFCTSAALSSSTVHCKSSNAYESQTWCWADALPASVSCCSEEADCTCGLLNATTTSACSCPSS